MPIAFNRHPALVAYITCGDPDIATTREIIRAAIRGGADVIELGVPFSDPLADGPVIQRASERALKHHTSLQDVLAIAAEIRRAPDPRSQAVGITGEFKQSPADHYVLLPYGPTARSGLRQKSAALCTWLIEISQDQVDVDKGYIRARLVDEIVVKVLELKSIPQMSDE